MDRAGLIKELNRAVNDDITALDYRHSALFTAALDKGVADKFLSPNERANYSQQLSKRRDVLFTQPMKDGQGQIITKNVKQYNGQTVTKPMTIKDLLEYEKDENGQINLGKYRIPEGMLVPIYPNGQVGTPTKQDVSQTLGKQQNLAKQIQAGQQEATKLEQTQGMSALTPGKYAAIAAGTVGGAVHGLASDAEAMYRVGVAGENKQKVFQDIYRPQGASPTLDPFAFGEQHGRFMGQETARGALPAAAGAFATGLAAPVIAAAGPLGLPVAFGASMLGAGAANEAQKRLFNLIMGDTGKQKIDEFGQPMVDPVTKKPIYENSFNETAGIMAEAGAYNVPGQLLAAALPNLIAGNPQIPALFNVNKIRQIATLAAEARAGVGAATKALEAMGIDDAAVRMAEQLAPKLSKPTGVMARAAAMAERPSAVAFKNAAQWLGEASGVTKAFGPRAQELKVIAAAIKSHPELSHFASELTESVAETGTEVQQAIQQRQEIDDYNAKARAMGLPEQEQNSLLQDLANVLIGVSFEGENRLSSAGYRMGANISTRAANAMGIDVNPYTRAIASTIKDTSSLESKRVTTLAPTEHIVGLGKGEFAIVNSATKTSRIVPAEDVDPALLGIRPVSAGSTGVGERMVAAADLLVPKAGFGKIAEFKPVGDNKEIVFGVTPDGYVIRRHLTGDNKADVRVVSVDQLAPENQSIASKYFEASGVKPAEVTGYTETHAYTNQHHMGLMERQLQGQNAEAFNKAFPAQIALDNNINVFGRIVKLVGNTHAAVQIPTEGRGTDMVVVPLQNIVQGTHAAKPPIDDSEVAELTKQSDVLSDTNKHNPVAYATNRVTDTTLDGGKNPVMLTPEQMAATEPKRKAIKDAYDLNVSKGMSTYDANKKRQGAVKSAKSAVVKGIAKDSPAYPVGAYIEHTDAEGNTVGAVVLGNTAHGPIVRPLNNGAPYVAQHTTITSGEPSRPEIADESGVTPEPTPTEDETVATPEEPSAEVETPEPSRRKRFKRGAVEVGVDTSGTAEEEISATREPTDTEAKNVQQGIVAVDGTMIVNEKEGKAVAAINAAISIPGTSTKTVADIIAQKPRNRQELEDALHDFLIGTPYKGKKMSSADARTAAKAIANIYDRMIFGQATRILQMTQDQIAGHPDSRVANPISKKSAEKKKELDYRLHHPRDYPLINQTVDMLDESVRGLTGADLTWKELSVSNNRQERDIAAKAVEFARQRLINNYYESSVPAIGKFTKIPKLNSVADGMYAAIVNADGQIAGRLLVGFANRDVSTAVHEVAHAIFEGMPADMQIDVLKHLGMTPRESTQANPSIIPYEAHEKFATSFEATVLNAEHSTLGIKLGGNRVTPVKYLEGVFDELAPFMRDVYGVVYGEDERPAASLTWRMPYQGNESSIFLWDNMPVIVNIDGTDVRCKIPMAEKWWLHHQGPGRLKADDPKQFKVEVVEFDHPLKGQEITITNKSITAIGGVTNGFNKRFASALTYWLSERANRANAERKYIGLTGYNASPAAISAAKATSKGAKVLTTSAGAALESGVEPTPTPTEGEASAIVDEGTTPEQPVAPQVQLPAPQMVNKEGYVSAVLPDIMTMPGAQKLDVNQVREMLNVVYDINRQNSSIARDKWQDYEWYGKKFRGNDVLLEVKRKSSGAVIKVNMTTGEASIRDAGKTTFTPIPADKVFAAYKGDATAGAKLQAQIDAVWAAAGAPEKVKPQIKGFMQYIAQLHGQAKGVFMPEWLPPTRSLDAPQTTQEVNDWLSRTHNVDGNTVTFETIPTVRGDMKVVDYSDRKMIAARINGVKMLFYISTGEAGKVKVQPGLWYPVFGIGSDAIGWINKTTSNDLVTKHNSPALQAVTKYLDTELGDLRNAQVKSVPMEVGSPEFNFMNDEMLGVTLDEAQQPGSTFNADAANIVAAIDTAKGVAKAKTEKAKAKQKKQPSPLIKTEPEDAAVLRAVGLKDLTQSDLDAIGRELLPDQYELVNNPDTPIIQKEGLMRLGYAKRIAKILTASSTDKEIAQGDPKNSNARQALQQVTTFVDEVIVRSRQQVAMAEAVDSKGRLKVFSDYELLTEPTDANPVVSIREKHSGDVYNVNVKTGQTTATLPNGDVNTQSQLRFLESEMPKFNAPNWIGGETEYVNTVTANDNMATRAQQISKRQGIPLDKMPQVYPGMLHIARILIAGSTNGTPVAPTVPANVLWKMNDTYAFNEANSKPVFQLRQEDRNKAVGKPITSADVKSVQQSTIDAVKDRNHDNHSMTLIDRSGIMRVKSEDEPTSAQELRAMVVDRKVDEIRNNKGDILTALKEAMRKKGTPVPEGAQPFVYRIIEPTEYIDEETGGFALKTEVNDDGETVPVLDKDGEPVKATRLVEKYVLSYAKQPAPKAGEGNIDLSSLEVYREDGTRLTDLTPYGKMEPAVSSRGRYVFYTPISASKDGNGSTPEAQDYALESIISSYQTLASRMLQKYTPIVKWDGNPLAGMQVWSRSIPNIVIKTPSVNGVPVASVVIGAAKTAYNIDAVGATNRWQSTEITRYSAKTTPVDDFELQNAVTADDKHYFTVQQTPKGFIYKMTATNIATKEVGVFTSDKTYETEQDAVAAAKQEYLLLRGQAYDIWHTIGAERIANDVVRVAELSHKDITADMTNEERSEILNAQVIMRQFDWYRGVSKKIMRRYGSAGLAMADLVGGTSPQTPVDANWTNAVQALQMMNRTATYERVVREQSDDKFYCKVPYNTERAVQVYSIWRAIKNKANYFRGANVDGSNTTDTQQERQRNEREAEYAGFMKNGVADTKAIQSRSDEDLKRFLGDEITSKLETKIPEEYKRKMLESVVKSLIDSTVWKQGGSDPVASFTGWAQKTDDWLPIDYIKVTPKSNEPAVEEKFTGQTKTMDFTVLPRNVFSGSKFGANTDNVLQGFFNTWLDIEDEGAAPKARNFSLNLVGLSSGATIDVWAARYLRRMYHEWHQDTPDFKSLTDEEKTFFARVPPSAEPGVEGGYLGKSAYSVRFNADGEAVYVPAKYQKPNPADPTTGGEFGTGQAVMGRATELINRATNNQLGMIPSDLQAIVWFAEKQLWMNNGWTNAAGAGGSFEYQFAQDVLRYGELDRFNVMMSGNGVRHLTPEQKERVMQIMRKSLWVNGDTAEGSPIAHLSALVSNTNGNQLDAGGQTQVDINLVAKRGSTPLKPYDPNTDVHALVLDMSPEKIANILSGKEALTLPSNLLNEHANRRISLAVMNGRELSIIGSGVFDGGQVIGSSGMTAYQMVPSNELTDSRPVIPKNPVAVKGIPDNTDVNQLVHIKPDMWKGRAVQVNGTGVDALYPARKDAGKHRRIREHQAYNVNQLKNASADLLRLTGGNDAVVSRMVGEIDGQDDINYTPESNLRIGHEIYFKPALGDERVDKNAERMYNEQFSNMMNRMEQFFKDNNAHVQFVVQQDPRNQYSRASLVNGNVGILAVWCPETEMRYMDYGAGVPENMMTQAQKDNNAKLMDYLSGDVDRIRQHEEHWNDLFKEFWEGESNRPAGQTIPIFQNFMSHYDVNTIHKEALRSETAPTTGIDDQSTAWGLGIREKLRHSVQQLNIGIGDGRVILEADTRSGAFNEVLAGTREEKLQSEAPLRVGLYQTRKSDDQREFHMHCTSYAGSRLPGLNGVYDVAMDALARGDQKTYEKAMARLSDRAGQELERSFRDMDGVEIEAERNTGVFYGDVEPSIDATIKVDASKYSVDDVLARAAHLGLMFRQQNVYVTQDAAPHEIAGEQIDGYTVEHRATFELSEPITFNMMKDIQKALNLGGANLSQDGKTLTTFTVATNGETHEQTREQWLEGISQIGGFLQSAGVSATFTEDTCRLWNTGSTEDGAYGKFTSYGEVLDNLRRRNPKALVPFVNTTDYNRNVNEVKADVEFALSMLKGRDIKLPESMTFKRTPVSVESQMAIADNYDAMPMNAIAKGPYHDPMAVKAYKSLIKELDKQWKWLNVKIDFMPRNVLPNGEIEFIDSYNASSAAVIEDIRNNNHLYIYPTTPDTFGQKGQDYTGHPLLGVSPHKTASGEPLLWNDVLRAVHDSLAHSIYGASFGAQGEEMAFATHAMLTEDPLAIWALNSETRAQNSWVNYNSKWRNPDGSMMKRLPPLRERPFAPQKASLMPLDSLYTGIKMIDDRIDKLRDDMIKNHNGYNGSTPAKDIVPVPLTDAFSTTGVAMFQSRTQDKDAKRITDKGLFVAGDVDILAPDGIRISDSTLSDMVDYLTDQKRIDEAVKKAKSDPSLAGLDDAALRNGVEATSQETILNRIGSAYLGHIQRGDIKNPAPSKGTAGYKMIINGITMQVKDTLKNKVGYDDADIVDVLDEWDYEMKDAIDEMESIGEWALREGTTWKDFGNRILDPVTQTYRNHHGELMPTEKLKDKFEWDNGRVLMYHASLHGKTIGNAGKLVTGSDLQWSNGKTDTGLGGTPDRISLTYSKTYAIDVMKMLTNYMRIANSASPKKALDDALTNRIDEALAGSQDSPINDRIRFKFTQLAHQYSTNMGVPYSDAKEFIDNLWETSGSAHQFVSNLGTLEYTNQYGTKLPVIEDVAGALMNYKNMGNGQLKGINDAETLKRQQSYHDYIRQMHYITGTPYSLIIEDSLKGIANLDIDSLNPVIYQYSVDPNMMAEHTPYEQELRTYTSGIMESTGVMLDAYGEEIPDVSESFVPSRPVFSWTLKRKGTVPVVPPAPPTPTVPQPQSISDRLWGAYDTFNDLCRVSVGGDASPILIQNFLLANPIEDPKLFFHQFFLMTKAARPNLSLSWKGKVIVDGKNFGRQADVDLGNELRANPFYADAKAHGLTLSAFGKDDALLELQKTNPSATMMDVNELGYNQDIAVSNEIMQHLPGQGASERFFSMSKDYVKMNKFAQAAQHLVDIGYIPGTPGYEGAARDLAAIINVAAGDISFPSKEEADTAFGRMAKRLFFAPRWATSRFAIDPLGRAILQNTPWGRDLLKRNRLDKPEDRNPYAKAMHTRLLVKTYSLWAALAGLYGLLYGNGAIKTSITKGGMQLQIGDYKFKPPAGIDKTMSILSSVSAFFESNDKKTNVEKVQKVAENIKVALMGQMAPGASAIYEFATGRNLFGEPSREVYTPLQRHWDSVTRPILAQAGVDMPFPKVSNMMADKFIYMWAQDMMESYEALKDRDEPYPLLQSTAIGAAAFVGGRVRYAPKELNWKYDAAKNREAPGIEHTIIGADAYGSGDMGWDKLTQ